MLAEKIAVVIGDRILLYSDLKSPDRQFNSLSCDFAAGRIQSEQLLLQAEKDGLQVSDESVESELDRRIRYYIGQYGSRHQLEIVAGKSIDRIKSDFRKDIRDQLLGQEEISRVTASITVRPAEVNAYYESLPANQLPRVGNRYGLACLVIYPEVSGPVLDYVDAELENLRQQLLRRGLGLCSAVKSADEKLCSEWVMDPEYPVDLDPAVRKAILRLQPGEISHPIRTKTGSYLLQRVDEEGWTHIRYLFRRPPLTPEDQARALTRMDSLVNALRSGSLSFEEAVKRFNQGGAEISGAWLASATGGFDLDKSELPLPGLEPVLDTLRTGGISAPVVFTDPLRGTGMALVWLRSFTPAHVLRPESDYAELAARALEQKKQETLQQWLNQREAGKLVILDPGLLAICPDLARLER